LLTIVSRGTHILPLLKLNFSVSHETLVYTILVIVSCETYKQIHHIKQFCSTWNKHK